jgi:hypothetical protein
MVEGYPGLLLVATVSARRRVYRYKSPNDGRMRQQKIGRWPAVSAPWTIAEWEKLREAREAGADPSLAKRELRQVLH